MVARWLVPGYVSGSVVNENVVLLMIVMYSVQSIEVYLFNQYMLVSQAALLHV